MDSLWNVATRMVAMPFRPKKSRVLDLLNDARTALAMRPLDELPTGYIGASRSCPISRGLSRMVGATGVAFTDRDKADAVAEAWQTEVIPAVRESFVVVLPSLLVRFIRDFDLGAYPRITQKSVAAEITVAAPPTQTPLVDAA